MISDVIIAIFPAKMIVEPINTILVVLLLISERIIFVTLSSAGILEIGFHTQNDEKTAPTTMICPTSAGYLAIASGTDTYLQN